MSFVPLDMKMSSAPVLPKSSTGIGARLPHFDEILETHPDVGFLEVHSENFFNLDSPPSRQLGQLRELYPISLHGVGLSLGSASGISKEHLHRLKKLIERIDPFLISEHLSWSSSNGVHLPDLLPLPMTFEALDVISRNISFVQESLNRQMLIENPSAYLSFIEQDMSEPEFLTSLVQKTGCKLIIDVNNIHVSAHNTNFDPYTYLANIPAAAVAEIHLAGYQVNTVEDEEVLIDAHNNRVYPPVWSLYKKTLEYFGDCTSLIEWDTDLPALSVLLEEAKTADNIRQGVFLERILSHAS